MFNLDLASQNPEKTALQAIILHTFWGPGNGIYPIRPKVLRTDILEVFGAQRPCYVGFWGFF